MDSCAITKSVSYVYLKQIVLFNMVAYLMLDLFLKPYRKIEIISFNISG